MLILHSVRIFNDQNHKKYDQLELLILLLTVTGLNDQNFQFLKISAS